MRDAHAHSGPALRPGSTLRLSAKARRTSEQPISYLIAEALKNPRLINLAAGLVDPLTLPVAECEAISRRLFADPAHARAALQYDTTHGLSQLRRLVLAHMERLDQLPASQMGLHEDDIVVTTGSQQALYLVGETLIDPGDIVIAANPSYFVYTGTLGSLGATVLSVPMDEQGMDVEAVGALLGRLEADGRLDRVKLVYCTSYYQNPTGLTLSAARRPRLLEIVRSFSRDHRILILEDAAYRELRYDGQPLRSIKSYDSENRYTIISHTFSKPFAPGLKLGYTAAPQDLLQAMVQQKGNHDFGSSNLTQHIAAEALRDGSYDEHVTVLQNAYRAKRDAMLEALQRQMPDVAGIHWTRAHGGLYVWLTLPQSIDTSRGGAMFKECVRSGVLYVPGDYCFQPDAAGHIPRNHIRLSFGQVHADQIEAGIKRLAEVVKHHLSAHDAAAAAACAAGSGAFAGESSAYAAGSAS
jgi:2-aminoadipate transaminase